MSVSRDQVFDIAALARLRLTDEEAELFAGQLSGILDHMAVLQDIPSSVADPGNGGDDIGGAGVLRPDAPPPDSLHASIDAFAPERQQGLFTVPRLVAMDGGATSDTDG